ncbi:pleiotropic drug resistance ABC transporter [Flammula alnicola]|nr:pleiotropic drug resistance ABC transporter [Flammula alnicola]
MSKSQPPASLNDIEEETPSGTVSRVPSQPTLSGLDTTVQRTPSKDEEYNHHHHHHEHHEHPPHASESPEFLQHRRNSSVSHVEVDFFDPAGVHELQRTVTHQNEEEKPELEPRSSESSAATLHVKEDEPFDLEKTLRRVIEKRDEAQIKARSLGIGFRDLRVVGLGASDSFLPTLGSLFNPRVILENLQHARHPNIRDILSGFEGVVKPGEMLLVLGSPGSGCSTLLKTLANQRQEYYAVHGDVHYDSITSEDLRKRFRGDVQYCPEDDMHFPTLSVDQTLRFAAAARTPRSRLGVSRKEFAGMVTTVLATIFGLRHTLTTPVGDAAIRGVSGGEKKRVSIAEGLASRSCIGAWDNSTRGLDASTALEFVRALRIATDTFEQTTIVSIYQAGESLYQHFDKVCIIYEGRMAYFGLASEAKQYFMDMGYEPANRQTTADFLVAVTDPNARIPRAGFSNQPRTPAEFADYFLKSELGKANAAELDVYLNEFVGNPDKKTSYVESARAELAKRSHKRSPYLLSIPQQVKIVMRRRVQIILGNKLNTFLVLFSYVFQALIMGSVFLNAPKATSAFFSRGGVLFFSLLFTALATMAEIPSLYSQQPIVKRHEKAALYHPFVEAMALTLVDIPITFATSTAFSVIVYFMAGLQRSAGQFFVYFLFLFTMSVTMKAWFRAIAAAFPSEAAAQTFAGISVLAYAIYTGYSIPKPSMIGALRWITYLNICNSDLHRQPMKYGFEAILTNEFRTLQGTCSNLVPQGPGYENVTLANQVCTTVGSVPGQPFVDGSRFVKLSFGFDWSNTWMNFGIVVVFGVAFITALLVFTEMNTSMSADTQITLFKRGPQPRTSKSAANDEENDVGNEKVLEEKSSKLADASISSVPRMTDIFSWQNVNYTVPIPGKEDRQLLSDVSGYVAPGKLTALMGESGAGKTTLLNVLAMRTDTGVITGDRFVNGQPLPADFQSQSGYCQQMDTHVPFSTVREALLFSAKLRQPPSVPLAEKEAYVEKCLEMCGLEAYADASVGSLSIEHKKRTTIAVELAAKPKLLLFLDEPTSGLDSQSSWAIMSFLRTLADNGQAILCTIHQPSAELFQRNGARACLPHENPAEYMLDVIGAGATATSAQNWYDIWQVSPDSKQTCELLKRDADAHWRDPNYLMAKLMLNAIGGLFIGFTFFKARIVSKELRTSFSLPGNFHGDYPEVPFINMRTIYEIRERPSRMYSWSALVASQILIELPWNVFGSMILFFSWYWTVGFETSRAGYTFLMIVIIFPTYYTTFGQPFRQLGWWKWMYRLSPYTYLIEGLLGQAVGRQQINCSAVEFVTINPPSGMTCEQYMAPYMSFAGGYLTNPAASTACEFCSVRTTDQFLEHAFNIFYHHHWRNIGILVAFIFFNNAISIGIFLNYFGVIMLIRRDDTKELLSPLKSLQIKGCSYNVK